MNANNTQPDIIACDTVVLMSLETQDFDHDIGEGWVWRRKSICTKRKEIFCPWSRDFNTKVCITLALEDFESGNANIPFYSSGL